VQNLCDRVAIIREGRIADLRKLSEMAEHSAKKVTVYGENLGDIAGESIKDLVRENGKAVFTWHGGDMNALVHMLGTLEIRDFNVEDIRLSDVFMSYYR